jgi:cell division protein FtsA
VEREAVLVGIDVGTTKVTALIGEVGRDGALTIIGKGTVPTNGLKKGVVVNIEQTVQSIAAAVEQAERLSGWKIDRAFVGVGGQHVESQNSRGAVAVSGHGREVSREDVNRATEVARAVQIPSNREPLHVLPRQFIVDGQEGVKDPLEMSAIRLEVETHIVTGSATAIQNLTKCVVAAGVKIDELLAAEMKASGHGMLPAGIVLTGGGAQLAGAAELGREVLQMPVRIAGPSGVGGLVDNLLTPANSTAIGLLRWGSAVLAQGEPGRYESAPAMGGLSRIREALRSIFP